MNNIRFILCAVCTAVLFAGCREKTKPHKIGFPPPAVFACRMIYGDEVIDLPNGETVSIELVADGNGEALKVLRLLKPSLKFGLCPGYEQGLSPRLYLVGKLTTELSEPKQSDGLVPAPKPVPLFRLQGWFVKVPYIEYPQVPEYGKQQKPLERKTLDASDFDPPIDKDWIKHDKTRNLFWIGIRPPANLPKHLK